MDEIFHVTDLSFISTFFHINIYQFIYEFIVSSSFYAFL